MNKMRDFSIEKQLIIRQYNDRWKLTDYNEVIKKLQCNHILSFSDCQIPSVLQENYEVPVSTCKFSSKCKDILAVANENGIVCIENIKSVKTLKYVRTHENTVYDIAWMPGSTQFVTVSGDNSAKLWDCTESDISLKSTFTGHKRSVRCVSFKPDDTAVFATGSRDGSLMIWDTRAWIKCAKFSHHVPDQIISSGVGSPCAPVKKSNISVEFLNSKSVTGLVFQNDNTLISCGSMDRYVRVWDMRKTYSRSVSNAVAKYQLASPGSGFSYLSMNSLGTKLYANCMDSYIYCFNINAYDPNPVAAFYGHENGSFYVKSSVSADGLYLMSGSSDECAYIWNTKNSDFSENAIKPFVTLNSHTAEVTCVEMCPDGMVVVSCSDDGTFRLWNPFTLKNNNRDRVDIATCYDVENVSTVKAQWKNKRKFKELEDKDSQSEKTTDCSSHTKICRFYTVNHSSPCICYTKFTQGKGEKRASDASLEKDTMRKRVVLEMQERTPPRPHEPKHLLRAQFVIISPSERLSTTPIKISSKRKLEDMPNFVEEGQKNKRLNCGKILTPVTLSEKNRELGERQKTAGKESQRLSKTEDLKPPLSALSSPTSNLPNYVEDGTSPYLHRCPKVTQKENDWLTKLRKSHKVAKVPEGRPLSPSSLTPLSLEKRKKNKAGDQTLHKYFKVSSKATEKSFAQDIQKKSILAKVDSQ